MKVYDRRTNKYLGTLVVKYHLIDCVLYLIDTTGVYQNGWDIKNIPSIALHYKSLLKENRLYWIFSEENCKTKNNILEI